MFDLAIVGIGATGISLLKQIQDQVCALNIRKPRVVLFGSNEDFARGKAFGDAAPNHRINTPISMMALSESVPNGFSEWINKQQVLHTTYPNRQVYSTFLYEAYKEIYDSRIFNIEEIRTEVNDIESCGEGYKLLYAGGTVVARKVVLCLGALHGPSFQEISDRPNFFSHHGQITEIAGERVWVAGSSLTAVDLFRTLNNKKSNEIHLFSRHGNAPTCISFGAKYTPSVLTWGNLQSGRPYSSGLSGFLTAMRDECKNLPKGGERRTALRIRHEMGLSHYFEYLMDRAQESDLPFQDVLVSTRPYMHTLWRSFSLSDRILFIQNYGAAWAAWRHPIPTEIMTELANASKEGRLHIHQSMGSPQWKNGKFHVPLRNARVLDATAFVDGTGGSSQLKSIPSRLIQNLLKRRLIESHPCGGMNVDTLTYQCTVAGRAVPGLYNLGPLSKGSLFATNAFWFNAQCAGHWARHWAIEETKSCETLV